MTEIEMFDALSEPFPPYDVEWRVGATNKDKSRGLPLVYIDARCVQDRLQSVCPRWQSRYSLLTATMAICEIEIQLPDGTWVRRSDGAGATDFEGEKGMLSDAFKRAAAKFGVGRYLYDMKSEWVELSEGKIPDGVRRELDRFYVDKIKEWGRGIKDRPAFYLKNFYDSVIDHFVTTPDAAAEFKEINPGAFAQIPVALRKEITAKVDKVGASA